MNELAVKILEKQIKVWEVDVLSCKAYTKKWKDEVRGKIRILQSAIKQLSSDDKVIADVCKKCPNKCENLITIIKGNRINTKKG